MISVRKHHPRSSSAHELPLRSTHHQLAVHLHGLIWGKRKVEPTTLPSQHPRARAHTLGAPNRRHKTRGVPLADAPLQRMAACPLPVQHQGRAAKPQHSSRSSARLFRTATIHAAGPPRHAATGARQLAVRFHGKSAARQALGFMQKRRGSYVPSPAP